MLHFGHLIARVCFGRHAYQRYSGPSVERRKASFQDGRGIYEEMKLALKAGDSLSMSHAAFEGFRRKKQNAIGSKTLVMDIDFDAVCVGERESLSLLADLSELVGFEPSFVVRSGGGLHVYYCLSDVLEPDDWKAASEALASHAAHAGLKCDSHSTKSIVHWLRLPGSTNKKPERQRPDGTFPVSKIIAGTGDVLDLDAVLGVLGTSVSPTLDLPPIDRALPTVGAVSFDAAVYRNDELCCPEMGPVVDGCAVLSAIDKGQAHTPYPVWRLVSRWCSFASDGRDWFEWLSEQDKGFTGHSHMTTSLFENDLETTAAGLLDERPTCRSFQLAFEEANPELEGICAACPLYESKMGRVTPLHINLLEETQESDAGEEEEDDDGDGAAEEPEQEDGGEDPDADVPQHLKPGKRKVKDFYVKDGRLWGLHTTKDDCYHIVVMKGWCTVTGVFFEDDVGYMRLEVHSATGCRTVTLPTEVLAGGQVLTRGALKKHDGAWRGEARSRCHAYVSVTGARPCQRIGVGG